MNLLEKANRIEIERLIIQNEKMKRLANREGFFKEYFLECKNQSTNREAFEVVNDAYFELFGNFRYSDHDSFRKSMNYQHKKNK